MNNAKQLAIGAVLGLSVLAANTAMAQLDARGRRPRPAPVPAYYTLIHESTGSITCAKIANDCAYVRKPGGLTDDSIDGEFVAVDTINQNLGF